MIAGVRLSWGAHSTFPRAARFLHLEPPRAWQPGLVGPCALWLLFLLAACEPSAPSLIERYASLPAHAHYAVQIEDRTRGRIHEERLLLPDGTPEIRTTATLLQPGNTRFQRVDARRFSTRPPHELEEHRVQVNDPNGDQHNWKVAVTEPPPHLADFLPPDAGPMTSSPEPRSFRQIGSSFVVRRVDAPPELDASPEALLAVPISPPPPAGPLPSLTLRVQGPAADLLGGASESQSAPGTRLIHTGETVPETVDLAPVRALVSRLHERVRFVPGTWAPDALTVLQTGRGDCREMALAFEHLATLAGLETRLVLGLALDRRQGDRFAVHQWNVVRIGATWVHVDPTWRQVPADGARITFPEDAAVQLDLQRAFRQSTLELVAVNLSDHDVSALSH